MNNYKKLLSLLLAALFILPMLACACSTKQNTVDSGNQNMSAGNNGSKSGGEQKDAGASSAKDAIDKSPWPSLRSRQLLTVNYNGKTTVFTGEMLSGMSITTTAALDKTSSNDRNGTNRKYLGISMNTLLKEMGLDADKTKKLILVGADGKTYDLTGELSSINIPSCTFALSADGNVLPDGELGCFIIIYKDGTRSAEHRGIVEIRLEF